MTRPDIQRPQAGERPKAGSRQARAGGADPRRGFTLIEILLAVVVFSIILVAINTVFYAALRLRNKTSQACDQALPLQRTFTLMKRDLANLVAPGGTLSGSFQSLTPGTFQPSGSATTTSGQSSTASTSATPTAVPLQGAIESSPVLYTTTGAIDDTAPWADIQQVTYALMQPTNRDAGMDLVRCATRNLLPVAAADLPTQERLMGGVQEMAFLFFDGLQWQNTWDSTMTTNTLPQAIKVQIRLQPEEGQRLAPPLIELVVPIDVQPRTNQTAQTTGGGS